MSLCDPAADDRLEPGTFLIPLRDSGVTQPAGNSDFHPRLRKTEKRV